MGAIKTITGEYLMRQIVYNLEIAMPLDQSMENDLLERDLKTDAEIINFLKQEIYDQGFSGMIPRKLEITVESL